MDKAPKMWVPLVHDYVRVRETTNQGLLLYCHVEFINSCNQRVTKAHILLSTTDILWHDIYTDSNTVFTQSDELPNTSLNGWRWTFLCMNPSNSVLHRPIFSYFLGGLYCTVYSYGLLALRLLTCKILSVGDWYPHVCFNAYIDVILVTFPWMHPFTLSPSFVKNDSFTIYIHK